jgi:AcrR family transcriptional regulator
MSNGRDESQAKRGYDARSRRHRAEQERADTRWRVLTAARRRFLSDGYAGTKMVDIAQDAGVALASVYRAGRGKAELLEMILELANRGDDLDQAPRQPLTFAELGPPRFPLIAAAADPQQQVTLIADRIAATLDRVGPLWTVLHDAAGVDAGAAATMRAMLERRAAAFEVAVGLLPADRLRVSRRESIDTLWAFSSPDTYLMLRTIRRWSHRRYRDWLRRTLILQLLTPPTDQSAPTVGSV